MVNRNIACSQSNKPAYILIADSYLHARSHSASKDGNTPMLITESWFSSEYTSISSQPTGDLISHPHYLHSEVRGIHKTANRPLTTVRNYYFSRESTKSNDFLPQTSGVPFREKKSNESATCFQILTASADCPVNPDYARSLAPCVAYQPVCRNNHGTSLQMINLKILAYSLPSAGPGADPGVQAVSLQVTF